MWNGVSDGAIFVAMIQQDPGLAEALVASDGPDFSTSGLIGVIQAWDVMASARPDLLGLFLIKLLAQTSFEPSSIITPGSLLDPQVRRAVLDYLHRTPDALEGKTHKIVSGLIRRGLEGQAPGVREALADLMRQVPNKWHGDILARMTHAYCGEMDKPGREQALLQRVGVVLDALSENGLRFDVPFTHAVGVGLGDQTVDHHPNALHLVASICLLRDAKPNAEGLVSLLIERGVDWQGVLNDPQSSPEVCQALAGHALVRKLLLEQQVAGTARCSLQGRTPHRF